MADFGMDEIKKLRERTGAGVMDCKEALQEKDGEIEAAIDYLREKGMAEAASRDKVAAEGLVEVEVAEDKKTGLVCEVNSETDFVARNDEFVELVEELSGQLFESSACEVADFLEEDWDEELTVDEKIREVAASMGENIRLRRFERIETDGFLVGYLHQGGQIGTLVEVSGEEDLQAAKNIAMHIAASAPKYIDRDEVAEEDIEREKKVYREQMINEGKPEHIIDDIVEGKIDKFYTQICLLEQEYVRDPDMNVAEYLEEAGLEVENFVRYEVGEGLDTDDEDFAEEVKAQVEDK
ncbi:translation elongation factor Ts [Halarsenatibacter silvermanii]|uniref:Elongation factor Ts n=1 Tax=Halarsenatibacter silvermanii TaxID=321763 RepID=A0A1G9LFG5_9FIRM|nr:translation elongation factor Ts [Halarsenatibacter silvermanii]SDL60739.1 translation elongation factor Ts (EF-Ts) [Halarsenatibacter silvermanii]